MKITHIGAKDCVTGSCHLLQTKPDAGGGINILVDCGLAQGRDPMLPLDQFPVRISDIDYLFLTHAHIDHIGRVPDPDPPRDHRQLLNIEGPAIIIAGSGMCTGGRIVSHLKTGLDDPANDIFFVGYPAHGTPGRAIREGKTPCRAAIHRRTGYSAHADRNALLSWVASMPKPPGEIRLVHGEPEAKKALEKKLTITPITQGHT